MIVFFQEAGKKEVSLQRHIRNKCQTLNVHVIFQFVRNTAFVVSSREEHTAWLHLLLAVI